MKKKLLVLAVMVMIFSCLLAIGASAANADNESFELAFDIGDKHAQDKLALWDEDGNGLVWYLDSENKLTSVKATELTLEYITQAQPYTEVGRIPAVNNAQCLSAIKHGNEVIQSVDGTKKIVVANLRDLSFEFIYEGNKTTLFAGNSTLQCLYLPNTVKRLANYCFCNSSALTSLDMGNSVQIIWDYAFGGTALTRLDCSNTCLYVGKYILNHATSIKEVHLGSSMQYLPLYWLNGTGNQMIDLYLPTTITNFGAPYNNYLTIFFTGSLEEAKTMIPSFGVVKFTYRPYSEFDGLRTTEECKWITYYDASECVAYYKGEHAFDDDGLCTSKITCTRCKETVREANKTHSISAQIQYANGFDKAGTLAQACTNDVCKYAEVAQAPALFECLGFSAPMRGNGGIAIGYKINNDAVENYEALTGKAVEYGVYAASKTKLGENDIFDANGNSVSCAIATELTSYNFTAFEIKIVGFAEDQKDLLLTMGAYVAIKDSEGTVYSYMQHRAPEQNEKYSFVSFNSVLALIEDSNN